jgi:hypothetical protein
MQLGSVRGLKQEIHAAFGMEPIRTRAGDRGVGIGVAPAGHANEYQLAIRVSREEDKEDKLVKQITKHAMDEVDLRVTGGIEVRPAADSVPRVPLTIGSSTGHYLCSAGTLGFFARRVSDGAIGIVSNNHVIAANNEGKDGDDILVPGPADRGRRPLNVVAQLDGTYPRLNAKEQIVDCAFGRIVRGTPANPLSLGRGERLKTSTVMAAGMIEVEKIGRTTGRTRGRISAFELDDLDVDYCFGAVWFTNQIEIESLDADPFSRPGDSGSLIFTRDGLQPLGLLFASSLIGGAHNAGLTYANPIEDVLSALGVTFM